MIIQQHLTSRTTRTPGRAGTPLRGARVLNVIGAKQQQAKHEHRKEHFLYGPVGIRFGGLKGKPKAKTRLYSHIAVKGLRPQNGGDAALDGGRFVAPNSGILCVSGLVLCLALYFEN